MHIEALYPRQTQGCITCPSTSPPCSCSPDQSCVLINRDCTTCASFKCVDKVAPPKPKGSNGGVVAGAVVGTLALVALAVFALLWYRRRTAAPKEPPVAKDIPASAETVLNRPNPTEKPPSAFRESIGANYANDSALNAGYAMGYSEYKSPVNPFEDHHSIQTAGTEGTGVIPIALVSPANPSIRSETSFQGEGPARPTRSPELNLNLDHVNVSQDTLRVGTPSQRSGISGVSRMSYMSGASYSSDFLNEAPMIITPAKAAVRQVLGVVKAEVIQAGSVPPSPSSSGLKPPQPTRPAVGSPLAAKSFVASDVSRESSEQELTISKNPFSDDGHSAGSPSTITSFRTASGQPPPSPASSWAPEEPAHPWTRAPDSRPTSMSTQAGSIIAGSIIDIGSATRVYLGPNTPGQPAGYPYQTAVAKLVTPSTANAQVMSLQQQQAIARARALDMNKRESGSSVATRADSILESFPFVPPSPISNRPIRSPPVSPNQQQFSSTSSEPMSAAIQSSAPMSPLDPPHRRFLGMSTASQSSTTSNGLGSFPFQIESVSEADTDGSAAVPLTATNETGRASLDTLALTKDLASYPLGFDSSVKE